MIRIRQNKYRNKPTMVDGMRFASKKEAARYDVLKRLQQAGVITGLQCQVQFPLIVNGKQIGNYYADFVYHDNAGNRVVEDVKGMLTPVYRIKKKHMFAQYGIEISEVGVRPKVRRARKRKTTGVPQ